jgi:plastocyanin
MLRRGTAGRRFWLVVALAAVGAMGYAAYALAADSITAADDIYSASTYTMNQGEQPNFTNAGLTQHNVTARQNGPDGKVLFGSPTLNGGQSAVLNGTQYLTAGTYTFFCTIHPTTMQARLVVTGNGTPQARPQVNNLRLKTKTIAAAIKKGLRVTTTPNQALNGVVLTVKLGKSTIARKTVSLLEGWNSVVVKLSKAGKKKLRPKSSAKVTVTAAVPFGFPATAKAKLK